LRKINVDGTKKLIGTNLSHDLFGKSFKDVPESEQPQNMKPIF
jgi:hypothetical protein